MSEASLRRSMLVTAIVTFLIILGGAGYVAYEIISELHDEDEARNAQTERIVARFVEGQSGVIKAILRAQENRADADRRQTREMFRRHILRIERDLRVLLVLLGGDPEDIPFPESSGANNEPPRREPEPRPSSSPTRSPKPSPSPSRTCAVKVGPICVEEP